MNLFAIAILFSGMVGGDSELFVPVSRESGPLVAGSHPGSAGRLDPRQPAKTQWPVSSKRTSPRANVDGLASVTGHPTQFAADSEPARLPVRNVGAIVANPIVGPTGGNPGNLLVLDASKANAKSYAWDVIPLDKDKDGKPLTTILPWDNNGARAIVASTPGTKTVILAVVDEGGKPTLWQWTIVVSGNVPTPPIPTPPDPPKPPEPPPVPLSGIAKVAHDEAMKLTDRSKAPAMAQAFRGLVQKIMDGAVADDVQAIGLIKQSTNATLGPQADLWKPWGNAVGAALKVKDPNTPSEWAAAVEQIAVGLEAVK